jgi:hypothetical protein
MSCGLPVKIGRLLFEAIRGKTIFERPWPERWIDKVFALVISVRSK